ncbi:MAG TPA: helix-turn-helix transcriptional regulator [Caulobacteraceae bacterium]|jgi:transcriptional regulator with XRE-family HTH domain|nr:helix-turn-helix transcriptional regulator [Caulobacteraceae bacterium]
MKDEANKTLKDFREAAKLTQSELASLMGLGNSAYQDLESGFSKFKPRHLMVLERVSLKLAVEREDIALALPSIRRDALDLAGMIRGKDKTAA